MNQELADAYREHRPKLLRYIARRIDTPGAEGDILHDVVLLTIEKLEEGKVIGNMRNWLYGVAWKLSGRYRRDTEAKTKRMREFRVDLDDQPVEPEAPTLVDLEQLRRHFAGLGPAQAEVLKGVSHGLTPTEVAAQTGRSVPATTMALSVGRKRLRAMLDNHNALD